MQGSDRFSINSLIDNRSQGSPSSQSEDPQDLSASEEELVQEARHAVTSFTVKDILDPHKFNALRRRSSESDSETESLGKEDAKNNPSWHSWMATSRLNRLHKSNGEKLVRFTFMVTISFSPLVSFCFSFQFKHLIHRRNICSISLDKVYLKTRTV